MEIANYVTILENKPHPQEESKIEATEFEIYDEEPEEKEVFPEYFKDFYEKWIRGVSGEKEVVTDLKTLCNAVIAECINTIRKEYSTFNTTSSVPTYVKNVLERNMMKIDK